jgi:two-component sensor histidine kinase
MSQPCLEILDPTFAPQPFHLVEEFTHRVVNEYTEAIGTLSLAAAQTTSRQARQAITIAMNRLRAHVEAHRALQTPYTEGAVDLADYIGRLCASISRASLDDRQIRLLVEADDLWLDARRCWRMGLIVAELVRNAARHGLPEGLGCIRVTIAHTAEGVSCAVRDNGRSGALNPSPGRGQRLVQILAAELGGAVIWRFTPTGCLAVLEIPARNIWAAA